MTTPEKNTLTNRGSIIKLFGVILIFIGTLDLMLFWRGGMPINTFYLVLIATGFLLYVVGMLKQKIHLE